MVSEILGKDIGHLVFNELPTEEGKDEHVKVNLIPNDQLKNEELSNYILETPSIKLSRAQELKQKLENSYFARVMLIFVTMMGTSMVIGDGIFTPAVSGSEAMFADLGHFSVRAIQISFTCVVFPAILIAYFGQATYLRKFPEKERCMFEVKNKVSTEYVNELVSDPKINRIPGIGLLYSELVQGIPPIFSHFIANIPSIHSVLVFVSIKTIPIANVALQDRFLFHQVMPREHRIFRCIVRQGYRDVLEDHVAFESQLVHQLKEFIRLESFMLEAEGTGEQALTVENETDMAITINATGEDAIVEYRAPSDSTQEPDVTREIEFIEEQREHGVIYMLGEAEVVASPRASIFNKVVVNYAYNFLRKNFLGGDRSMPIPPNRLLKVGMVYEI
ncbi:hypothetical protein Fmac_010833 [Flemingia macrophylla]|uniref:Potassium transporter n=1 Tax=Flemingia macrophylla TaxID=520843 RepID=A0ABD1MKP6_9FABA